MLERTGNLDSLTVVVERREDAPSAAATEAGVQLQRLVKNSIGVSIDVHVVDPAGVERSMGKMKRIVDNRAAREVLELRGRAGSRARCLDTPIAAAAPAIGG